MKLTRHFLFLGTFFAIILSSFHDSGNSRRSQPSIGFSFSPAYADYLGLDPQDSFSKILDSFSFQAVRLPVYWNRVLREGRYDFSEIDDLVREAKNHGLEVVLAAGYRSFRWPECYAPDGIEVLPYDEFEKEILSFWGEVLKHFANTNLIDFWQVENETYVSFGNHCRFVKTATLFKLVDQVREYDRDDRPVIFGVGGTEVTFLPSYWGIFRHVDIISASFYPRTIDQYFGFYIEPYDWFPIAPRDIERERQFVSARSRRYWISEFQAEPWQEDATTMSPDILLKNWDKLTSSSELERVFVWGVEWWLKEKKEGRPELFKTAQELFMKDLD